MKHQRGATPYANYQDRLEALKGRKQDSSQSHRYLSSYSILYFFKKAKLNKNQIEQIIFSENPKKEQHKFIYENCLTKPE